MENRAALGAFFEMVAGFQRDTQGIQSLFIQSPRVDGASTSLQAGECAVFVALGNMDTNYRMGRAGVCHRVCVVHGDDNGLVYVWSGGRNDRS